MSTLTDLFSKTSASMGSFFAKKPDAIIGIDIGSSAIKIVEIKKEKGVVTLGTYGEVALGPYAQKPAGSVIQADPDLIAQALIDVVKESHSTARSAVVCIQSSASLLFVLSLPEQALSALDTVVPNEARKYIPVPLSEVSLNWDSIPSHIQHRYELEQAPQAVTASHRDILVAATRNDALSGYRNIMAQAQMDIHALEIEIFSTLRSLYHNELTPFAIVDIGASGVRIAIVHYGVVMQYDVVPRGGSAWTETLVRSLSISFEKAEELKRTIGIEGNMSDVVDTLRMGATQLVTDIRSSLQKYERQHNVVIDHVVLSGGGARMPGLLEYLNQQYAIEVRGVQPFDALEVPDFLKPVLASVGPEFAGAVGAALKGFA